MTLSRTVRRTTRLLLLLALAACTRAGAPADAATDTATDTAARTVSDTAADSAADPGPIALGCSADARPGLVVTAADARTGETLGGFTLVLAADSAHRTVTIDSVTIPDVPAPVFGGAQERPGRYALRVTKAGYRPWDTTGVVVTADRCHVRTVRLRVRLVPQS